MTLRWVLLMLLLLSSGSSRSQTVFPATAQGEIAETLLEVITSGDSARMEAFLDSRVHESALGGSMRDEWRSLLRRLYEDSQGLDAVSVTVEDPRVLNVLVQARAADRWSRLVLISSRSDSTRMADIFVLTAVAPDVEKQRQFPVGKMSEAEIIKVLEQQCELRSRLDHFSGVVLVAKGSRVLFHRAYGMAEQSFQIPNTTSTRFHLGSMDKMFTGVAIAQLVQEGRLRFEDTLAAVVPDFPDQELARRVTIHQLLTHTAGTGDFISHPDFRAHRERFVRTSDYIPLIAGQRLFFDPGRRFSYSNSGYVLLGLVIEKVSGMSYFEYVQQHVFRKAGMDETAYLELNEVVRDRATGYLRSAAEDPFGIRPRRSNVMFIPFKGNSAGGGYSTARDLWKFALALKGGELLDKGMMEFVTEGKVDMAGGPRPERYGYGFGSRKIGGKEVRGMGGGGPSSGVDSNLAMFWDGSYTVVVVGNYDAPAADELKEKICEFLASQ